jgi:poly-gamma-glutamate synthesis protein (capsule biosynthesis protein)
MVGRGIDQVLPHPSNPKLYEPIVLSAIDYVALAEQVNGPIPKPVDFHYVWGDALAELDRRRPHLRLINLETAVTNSREPAPKGINYKVSPANFPVIRAARVDCCSVANNHILDWGRRGLLETLQTVSAAGIKSAGAGRNLHEAAAPVVLPIPGKGRVIVVAFGSPTSGVPLSWSATERDPGINVLPTLSRKSVDIIAQSVRSVKAPGDIVVVSIHWGPNRGYGISSREAEFAHRIIDEAGIDIVHGHSSHHPKAIEVYRDRLILFGCGDFLNDYEGIGGREEFRTDLVLMYLPTIRSSSGKLMALKMIPFSIKRFRLNRASLSDAAWLCEILSKEGRKHGTRVDLDVDGSLTLAWD